MCCIFFTAGWIVNAFMYLIVTLLVQCHYFCICDIVMYNSKYYEYMFAYCNNYAFALVVFNNQVTTSML